MYRGFKQNKKHSLTAERSYAKPRLVAGVLPPLLSTEIICRTGFLSGIFSNFPSQPIHRGFIQPKYNTNPVPKCQAFATTFFKNFQLFLPNGHICPLSRIKAGVFPFCPAAPAFPPRTPPVLPHGSAPSFLICSHIAIISPQLYIVAHPFHGSPSARGGEWKVIVRSVSDFV